jgi:hypothetical protein
MTEFEAIDALSSIADTFATFFTVFLSLTFGYLTVAYIVGGDLTRFQYLVISGIYFLSASIIGAGAIVWVTTWEALNAQEPSIFDDIWIANALSWSGGISIIVILVTLVSLYFMYNVRSASKTP